MCEVTVMSSRAHVLTGRFPTFSNNIRPVVMVSLLSIIRYRAIRGRVALASNPKYYHTVLSQGFFKAIDGMSVMKIVS
jgi:hypothetical protein